MAIQIPKGTKDVLPGTSYAWHYVEKIMREKAEATGYREIRTPVFEHTELFLRGVGDTTDIVQKEMYTFNDKGGRSITLKPEGTAGAVRAFIEGRLFADPLPCKMYYLNAPIFRYENPQAGRLREHHQFGMECFGGSEPTVEAELISTLLSVLDELGLKNLVVHINSIGCPVCRGRYQLALKAYFAQYIDDMCPTCKGRFDKNPLRILDCKEEKCRKYTASAPCILDYLCEECSAHFKTLQDLLSAAHITYKVDPKIVRGLDYYTKTVFEIIMQSNAGGLALCGGGRYDGLVEQLDGPATPAAGFGIGIERILIELEHQHLLPEPPAVTDVYVANIDKKDLGDAFIVTQGLRAQGFKADCNHAGRSLKGQFKFAGRIARLIVMVGGDEWARGNVKVKNLETHEEREIAADELTNYLNEQIK